MAGSGYMAKKIWLMGRNNLIFASIRLGFDQKKKKKKVNKIKRLFFLFVFF